MDLFKMWIRPGDINKMNKSEWTLVSLKLPTSILATVLSIQQLSCDDSNDGIPY